MFSDITLYLMMSPSVHGPNTPLHPNVPVTKQPLRRVCQLQYNRFLLRYPIHSHHFPGSAFRLSRYFPFLKLLENAPVRCSHTFGRRSSSATINAQSILFPIYPFTMPKTFPKLSSYETVRIHFDYINDF